VLIPEMNLGQLRLLVRARYLIDAVGLNRVRGKPFRIVEIQQAAEALLAGRSIEEPPVEATAGAPRPSTPAPDSAGGGG
jgi:2-oxoglutarate ferredoxin oxidoreductase subunit alpha